MEHCNTVSLYTIKLMMIIQGTIELRYNIRSAWFLDIRISTCFLRTPFGPREWLAVCGLVYLVYLFFSYLSHALLDFSKTGTTFYLMHTLQVQQFSELSCHLILF